MVLDALGQDQPPLLHRARERLIAERTTLINQLRSLLPERGITVAQGRWKLEKELPDILNDATWV